MLLAYNTNGLAHHDLLDGIELLAEIGYRGVAITLDHGSLNPYGDRLNSQLDSVAAALAEHEMRCAIETGARFLLDPRVKHEPTLVTADPAQRARRVDFLCRTIDIAARLNATCVSLWSGIVGDGAGDREAFDRLAEGLAKVIAYAAAREVPIAFEPEPGMLVDTIQHYDELLGVLQSHHIDATRLGLTLDIGHLHCQGELPIAAKIEQYADRLANVHIEDMRAGIHEHLMFGEGEIGFRPVIAALARIGYAGVVGVELSRHSHEGPQAARKAYDFLQPLVEAATAGST
jgi:L-ribulose-5-phosphate 3-epimerase